MADREQERLQGSPPLQQTPGKKRDFGSRHQGSEGESSRGSSRNSPRRLRIRPDSAPPDTSVTTSALVSHLDPVSVTDTPLSSVRGNDTCSPEQRVLGALDGPDSRGQRPKSALRAAAAAAASPPTAWSPPRRRLSSRRRVSVWETSPLEPLRGLSDSLARAEQQRLAALQPHRRPRLPRGSVCGRAAEGTGLRMQARRALPRTSGTRQQPCRDAALVAPFVQSPYRDGLYEGGGAGARRGKGSRAAREAGGRRQHVAGAYEESLCGLAGRTLANGLEWGGGDGLGGGLLCADGGRMREEQRLNALALRRFQP